MDNAVLGGLCAKGAVCHEVGTLGTLGDVRAKLRSLMTLLPRTISFRHSPLGRARGMAASM